MYVKNIVNEITFKKTPDYHGTVLTSFFLFYSCCSEMAHYVYPAAANTAQPAQAYPAVQTAFVAATPQAAAYATAPRAGQAYDAYQTQHTTPQYAYARTQVAVTVNVNLCPIEY